MESAALGQVKEARVRVVLGSFGVGGVRLGAGRIFPGEDPLLRKICKPGTGNRFPAGFFLEASLASFLVPW
jgi:hypothetical protein